MAKANKKGLLVLEGAAIGAALGVVGGILAGSETGKKVGKKVKGAAAGFYQYLSPQLKKAKKMGEDEYKAFVAAAVQRYNKDKKLSEKEVQKLTKETQSSWKHLVGNL